MNPPRSIDQPGVTVVEITDPSAASADGELIDIDAVQLQSMPFRARRVTVRLETLLATLRVAKDLEPTRSDLARQAQNRIVKTAEAYALSNAESRLYVTDLCRIAAVSERTLEYAFKEVLGLTPMAYLVRMRLHRARKALLAATPRSTTVSAEALNWGFWHFGEFSRAYRACFGEAPSETLRRKAAEPRR